MSSTSNLQLSEEARVFLQRSLAELGHDSIQHLLVDILLSSNNSLVVSQCPSNAEVQRLSNTVSNNSTGLLNEELSSGVVLLKSELSSTPRIRQNTYPDFLLVRLGGGKTEVDITITTSDRSVLGLRVHANRVLGNSKGLSDGSLLSVGGVTSLNTLTEGSLGKVGDLVHGDGGSLNVEGRVKGFLTVSV
jgi:hypothetical protein